MNDSTLNTTEPVIEVGNAVEPAALPPSGLPVLDFTKHISRREMRETLRDLALNQAINPAWYESDD